MTRDEVYKALDGVFQEVFDDDTIHVSDSTTAKDIEDWDSLEHINLVVAVEQRFGVKLSMGEIINLKNVGEMVDILLKKICSR